jgi:DNA-binding transcriptional regulator GbsR (MarR family)
MALTTSYLVTTKNFDAIFNALLSAKAPTTLSTSFLKTLGFTSSNDSLYIRLFKDLGLIDSANVPTEKYYRFLDQAESKKVIAECIEEAYSDLFAINITAYELTESEIKNKLKTLTQGSKEDNILALIAKTFKTLCDYADWSKSKTTKQTQQEKKEVKVIEQVKETQMEHFSGDKKTNKPSLHYNIQIHLPETRDTAVYDAIFKSLKEHLL